MPFGILISLISPMFDALGNIIDSKLSNTFGIHSMVFYSIIFNILFLPFIFLFGIPHFLSLEMLPFVIFLAFVETFYLYPYVLSLKSIDTSIVTALFSLGKIIIPILAFFMVGEVLTSNFYIGFFIITISSILLSLQQKYGKIHLNKAFFYMLVCSFVLSFTSVLEKYTLKEIDYITVFFRVELISTVFVIPFVFFKKIRKEIFTDYSILKQNLGMFTLQSLVGFLGVFFGYRAISIVPITVFKAVGSLQIFIVLFFSFIICKFHPQFICESFDKKELMKKIFFFGLILIALFIMGFENF